MLKQKVRKKERRGRRKLGEASWMREVKHFLESDGINESQWDSHVLGCAWRRRLAEEIIVLFNWKQTGIPLKSPTTRCAYRLYVFYCCLSGKGHVGLPL